MIQKKNLRYIVVYFMFPFLSSWVFNFCNLLVDNWHVLSLVQPEVFRTPPLPNLLKDEGHQYLIVDVSIFLLYAMIDVMVIVNTPKLFLFFTAFLWLKFFNHFKHVRTTYHVANSYARHWCPCEDMRKLQILLTSLWGWPTTYCLLRKRKCFDLLEPVSHQTSNLVLSLLDSFDLLPWTCQTIQFTFVWYPY